MLSVAEARGRILAGVTPLPGQWVALPDAWGRVAAADVTALHDQPPTAVSAMDGYAVRAADTVDPRRVLRVVGEAPAGRSWPGTLGAGEAVRIFTGGPLPDGADAIAIQENAERVADGITLRRPATAGEFVRPAGLDFRKDAIGITAGTVIDARALGLAAAMGHGWLRVRRRPRVGIIATGDEIAWPGTVPGPDQIASSNSTTLAAMVRGWGGEPVDLGIAADRPEALVAALREAVGLDVLVTSGGASVGDYDLVQAALAGEGLELGFWRIAMRPGKPLLFGRLGRLAVLGLPGNPVSSAVCAVVFLRALLLAMHGLPTVLRMADAAVTRPLPENDRREDYLRARWVDGADVPPRVEPAGRQDSSMMATFAHADVLIVRPPHDPACAVGEVRPVIDLRAAIRSLA